MFSFEKNYPILVACKITFEIVEFVADVPIKYHVKDDEEVLIVLDILVVPNATPPTILPQFESKAPDDELIEICIFAPGLVNCTLPISNHTPLYGNVIVLKLLYEPETELKPVSVPFFIYPNCVVDVINVGA